jgi:hypothetical protein
MEFLPEFTLEEIRVTLFWQQKEASDAFVRMVDQEDAFQFQEETTSQEYFSARQVPPVL